MILACASSLMFAGVGFHMANNYTGLDDADGATVTPSWGVNYDLNGQTSVGWDSELGMMMHFAAPAGTSLRLGWVGLVPAEAATCENGGGNADGSWDGTQGSCIDGYVAATEEAAAKTSLGLGFTWWTGGAGLNTSISTNFDYVMQGSDNSTNLSVTVGFGF